MMKSNLPDSIDPFKCVEIGAHFEGEIPIVTMKRLADILERQDGVVAVSIYLGTDEGIPFLKGKIKTTLWLLCQRCLQPMQYNMATNFSLSPIINDSQASQLPEGYEPLLVKEQRIVLSTVIEDEILLALPIAAKHEDCSMKMSVKENRIIKQSLSKPHPFAKLAELKRNK